MTWQLACRGGLRTLAMPIGDRFSAMVWCCVRLLFVYGSAAALAYGTMLAPETHILT
jgi:uncharacterized membrane protein